MRIPTLARLAGTTGVLWYGLAARAALAQNDLFGEAQLETVGERIYGSGDQVPLPVMIGNLIRIGIGFLGLVFLLLMVYGGWLWFQARGNKEDVQKAKDTMTRAIIGLVIITAAYAITTFIVAALVRSLAAPENNLPF